MCIRSLVAGFLMILVVALSSLAGAQDNRMAFRAVVVEGNTLFSGTYTPQSNPFEAPYADEEALGNVRFTAERNGKLFLLDEAGTLYYPCPQQGTVLSESMNAPRIRRVLTDAQQDRVKSGAKLVQWTTLVHMVGRAVEVEGIVYPGYAGVRGIFIEAITYEEDE